ncbi:MAG: flagellar filament capping protein FliD [candidate division Zixibacteria bacterium]|nr:flagellar filament capping protein FliD [candidate division Zixibacteria bacterium]
MAGQQIDGIMSSLDTTQIIQTIIETEAKGLQLMQADKKEKTNQISVYNTISAKLISMKLQASKLAQAATFDAAQAEASNSDYITATIKGQISEGQYTVSVGQLASNHQIASQGFESETSNVGTGTFTIQVGDGNSVNVSLDEGNNTLKGLKDAINSSGAGVKAAIINDGSENDPYRLLLTSLKSGTESEISITSTLTGGTSPDFENSIFDEPEVLGFDSGSTSTVSLGTSASYTGNANKTYTFTVEGSGSKTIGTDAVTINWSDGTNSGSIELGTDYVPGSEVVLAGDGADGLTLSFSAGTLNGGDDFQVQTLAPVLQAARDARITLGSSEGGGSPITVTSSTNTVDDLIPGVSLNLKKVTDAQNPSITINTSIDVNDLESQIKKFIESYNTLMDEIDKQFEYKEDTKEAGILFGDTTLLTIQNRLRSSLLLKLDDVDGEFSLLSQLGIRHSQLGELRVADSGKLRDAIQNNLDDVIKFFTNSANSNNSKISFAGATSKTKAPDDGFTVNVTQAATHGYLKGTAITDPSQGGIVINDSNYKLKLKVDGLVSEEITLARKTYNSFQEIASELQSKINQDAKIGDLGVTVDYMDNGETGYLRLSSAKYGEDARVEIQAGIDSSAFTSLGLAKGQVIVGRDVAGTINGEEAEGKGQMLTGMEGNRYSDGLSLKVELEEGDLINDGNEATVVLVKGFATQIDELLDMYSAQGEGVIANRTNAIQRQIDSINENIEDEEERLKIRQQSLFKQYYDLEQALGQWNSTASYLETQFANIDSNWKFMGK